MKAKFFIVAVSEIMFQAEGNAPKCDLIPWNISGLNQSNLKALVSSRECRASQVTTVKQMNLIDVRDADHAKRRINDGMGTAFFERFSKGALGSSFIILHKASR
jgi:hypothetical protein